MSKNETVLPSGWGIVVYLILGLVITEILVNIFPYFEDKSGWVVLFVSGVLIRIYQVIHRRKARKSDNHDLKKEND